MFLKNKAFGGKFWVGSCWMNRSSSDKRRRSFQAKWVKGEEHLRERLWNVTRAEVVGEQVEGGWSNLIWTDCEKDVPLRDFSVGPWGGGRCRWEILEVLRVRTCSKSCTRVGRMGRMWEDGLGWGKCGCSACEDGKVRDQMIVDRNLEVDWKQEGHFSGGPVRVRLCLSVRAGWGQAPFSVGS